jgi:peptidoglycan biosynthesis protein MviN/MurJ (putative lipid II flippase)
MTADLIRISAAFLLLQFVAGELAAVALARGQRIAPTLAPGLPSIVAVAGLAISRELDVRVVYELLALGSVFEILFLILAMRRPIRVVPGSAHSFGVAIVLMAFTFALLSMIPAAERITAATYSAASAVQYDYAMRSLRAVQLLILGGLFFAALADWSSSVGRDSDRGRRESLAGTLTLAGNILVLSGCIALVAAHLLVATVYQHGGFTAADTDAVTNIVLLALPGFWAEGTGLMITTMLIAIRRNIVLAAVGTGNFVVRMLLIVGLGLRFGGPGIAIAYSIAAIAALVILSVIAWRLSLLTGAGPILRRGAVVAVGTLAVALIIFGLSGGRPEVLTALPVIGIFALLSYRFQTVRTLRLLPK